MSQRDAGVGRHSQRRADPGDHFKTDACFDERYSRYLIFGICKSCFRKQRRLEAFNEQRRFQTTVVRDALELTLAIERRGYTFYTNASQKTKNGSGRRMFQRLAAEESDHLRRLQQEHRSLLEQNQWLKREPARLPLSRKIVEEIFPQKELLKIEVKDETSDIDALNIAMNLERRSHQFFKDFADHISDTNGRKIFMDFAKDEESHLKALVAEYNTLVGS